MFIVGIITITDRLEMAKELVSEFEEMGLEVKLFVDEDRKGHWWNLDRMVKHFCELETDKHIILCMDDIELKPNIYGLLRMLIEETDYDVLCGFTNKGNKPNDIYGIHRTSTRFALYDPLLVYRNGVLCRGFYNGLEIYMQSKTLHQKAKNHYDNLLSSYLYFNDYKCGIVRPNLVTLKDVPSTLGHSIGDRDARSKV